MNSDTVVETEAVVDEQENVEEVVEESSHDHEHGEDCDHDHDHTHAPEQDPRYISYMRKQLAAATKQTIENQKRRKANKLAKKNRRTNRQNNSRKGQ